MFRLITSREDYKLRPRFRNPSPKIPSLSDVGAPTDFFYHLDAADAVQGATSWTSKEGKVFGSTGLTKTNGVNGLPSISQTSRLIYDMPSGTSINQQAGNTIFVVGTAASTANYQRLVSQSVGTTQDWQQSGGTIPLYTENNNLNSLHINVGVASPLALTLNSPTLWVSRRDGTSLTNYSYRAGTTIVGPTATVNSVTAAFTRFTAGGSPQANVGEAWTGQIAEVIYYNRYLSNSEFEAVRDFLRTKYAL